MGNAPATRQCPAQPQRHATFRRGGPFVSYRLGGGLKPDRPAGGRRARTGAWPAGRRQRLRRRRPGAWRRARRAAAGCAAAWLGARRRCAPAADQPEIDPTKQTKEKRKEKKKKKREKKKKERKNKSKRDDRDAGGAAVATQRTMAAAGRRRATAVSCGQESLEIWGQGSRPRRPRAHREVKMSHTVVHFVRAKAQKVPGPD